MIITDNVARHHTNNRYKWLLVQFEQQDKHFFWNKRNWLPKDDEVIMLCRGLFNISPTFRKKIIDELKVSREWQSDYVSNTTKELESIE